MEKRVTDSLSFNICHDKFGLIKKLNVWKEGIGKKDLSVCLCPHPCLHLSPSLHVSLCLHVCLSLSMSLFLSASMSVSILHLSPSLFLHLSVSRSIPQSLLVFLSLSPCVSLSPFGLPLEDLAALMRVSAGRTGPVTSHVPERWRPAASTRVTGNRLDRKAARSLGRNDF